MTDVLQVKEIRNKMFHSPDFKLTNTEMKDHIKAMKTMLKDPTQLMNDANSKKAVWQLQQVTQNHSNDGINKFAKIR